MAYRALLFDLDGTLLNTLEDLANACNRVLAAMGHKTHAVPEYRFLVGSGVRILVERMLPAPLGREVETVEAALAAFREEYARCWHEHSRPYPDIADLLDDLVQRGLELAVLSNKPQHFTELCVQTLLPSWPFRSVLGQREGVPKKPDPAGALETARLLGLAPAEMLYVGDSDVDMLTAKHAGMSAVGVLWGFRGADELRAAGADVLAERPGDILRYLDRSL